MPPAAPGLMGRSTELDARGADVEAARHSAIDTRMELDALTASKRAGFLIIFAVDYK